MDKIKIFTICTNTYNQYLYDFINTLDKFFMPKVKKEVYIISDKDQYFKPDEFNTISDIIYHHIFHQYYEFIQLSKLDFITQSVDNTNDIFFYFDVDTKFIEKSDDYWESLTQKISNAGLIFCKHPSYIYHSGNNKLIQNESFANMKGASKFNYTPESVYLCTSMFGGKVCYLNKLKLVYDKLRNVDYKQRYLGSWGDEHYINRLVNDSTIRLGIQLTVGQFAYVDTPATHDIQNKVFETFKNVLCIQKYDIDAKTKIKDLES